MKLTYKLKQDIAETLSQYDPDVLYDILVNEYGFEYCDSDGCIDDVTFKKYLIEIPSSNNLKCYLASGEGDPPRTLDINHAVLFNTYAEAEKVKADMSLVYPDSKFLITYISI